MDRPANRFLTRLREKRRILCVLGILGITGLLVFYPWKDFSIGSSYEHPKTIARREEINYPDGFYIILDKDPLVCLFADELYQRLAIKKISLEYNEKEIILVENQTIYLERHGNSWNRESGWYWKYMHLFNFNPHYLFRKTKIGDEFDIKLHLIYSLDDKPKEQVLPYHVEVFRWRMKWEVFTL